MPLYNPPGASSADLTAHAADTTSVHGVADTAALALSAVPVNDETDDYTLVLSDRDKAVHVTKATAVAVTFPPNVFAVGDCGEVVQWGAGQVTATEGDGVEIRSSGDKYTTVAQYSTFSWRCVASNEFHIAGELEV